MPHGEHRWWCATQHALVRSTARPDGRHVTPCWAARHTLASSTSRLAGRRVWVKRHRHDRHALRHAARRSTAATAQRLAGLWVVRHRVWQLCGLVVGHPLYRLRVAAVGHRGRWDVLALRCAWQRCAPWVGVEGGQGGVKRGCTGGRGEQSRKRCDGGWWGDGQRWWRNKGARGLPGGRQQDTV
eukprot:362607-Chlamydomonas_euryale.AAC.11